jgi:hypothetical protein
VWDNPSQAEAWGKERSDLEKVVQSIQHLERGLLDTRFSYRRKRSSNSRNFRNRR